MDHIDESILHVLKGFRFGMLLQIAIGPVCLTIFQAAAAFGFWKALTGVLGVALVDGLYIFAALCGLGAVLNKYNQAQRIIKYFGMIVLIIFGISSILGVFGISFLPILSLWSNQSSQYLFLRILLLTLSNPLTIIFWAGVFSAKLAEERLSQKEMYLFGIGAVLSTFCFLVVVAFAGSFINYFLNSFLINGLNMFVGVVLIIFGLKLGIKKKVAE